ncbi:MAG: AbrB/MazE/SpoVT family DNA-binding domain-containing protein [Asgard group archaeon]|nr:AbrB/MazE/SpoVT family DNA-binding domain-containing protein [Asgard group archaeon]
MNDRKDVGSTINLTVSENHNLLYFNIPKEVISELDLNTTDLLEYDVRENQFFIRKKGSQSLPTIGDSNIFSGLLVERTITKNNTVLRTNLPKEVAQPLNIKKGDSLRVNIDGKIIIGYKNELK